VYLAHTPQFFPFGPESWHPDPAGAALVREAAGIVTIGEHMAGYVKRYLGRDAAVIHPPIYGMPPWPDYGRYGAGPVLMVNPCAVKGISIFLALADRFADIEFAALESWGTTARDRRALASRDNVRIVAPVKRIDEVLSQTRCLLMPSLWYEGFGLIAMEALLAGVPVIASDSGGLEEAKRGTHYLLGVRPVERYEMIFDDRGMPRAVLGEQRIEPWVEALRRLLNDEEEYWAESKCSREAARAFVAKLDANALEHYLEALQPASDGRDAASARLAKLTPAQRAMLLNRLRAKKDL
jgi:glycosyltransferase involved in cell wall biosynthesis